MNNARYQVDGAIGQGGMGSLYRATDTRTGEPCVIKELDIGKIDDLKALELFEREIEVLGQLDHPRIPRLRDHYTVEGEGQVRLYLVQDLVEGQDLDKLIKAGHRFNTAQILKLGRSLIDVLIYLHRRRPPIIHRDIKPANIILRPDGEAALVDFGAVRHTIVDSALGGSTVVGTFGFMAPEQLRGHAEPATDVYGLGATMLYLFTGRDPSDFDSTGLKLDLRSDSQLSEPVVQLLEAMMEPEVEERRKFMPQLLRAFERVGRNSLPFVPDDGPIGDAARLRASVEGRNQGLPEQVARLLTPEIVQLADDLRDVQITIDRCEHKLAEVEKGISVLDKLNFLHDTPAETRAKKIKADLSDLHGQRAAIDGRFTAAVERRALDNPLFSMRRDVDAVKARLAQVRTDEGENKKKKSCRVYNLSEVFGALERVEKLFRGYTDVASSFDELSSRIEKGAKKDDDKRLEKALKGLGELEAGIVERSIAHLRARGYPQLVEDVKHLSRAWAKADKEHKKAKGEVKFLDWVNIFTESPEQVRLSTMARQLGGVYQEMSEARSRMQQLYRSTLEGEALLGALFAVAQARAAVDQIEARCEERTRTEVRTNSKGKVKTRTKTVYVCVLYGVDTAHRKVEEAERAIWGVLGRPMTLEELKRTIVEQA